MEKFMEKIEKIISKDKRTEKEYLNGENLLESKIEKTLSQIEELKELIKEKNFSSKDVDVIVDYLKGKVSLDKFKEFSLRKLREIEKEEQMMEKAYEKLENLGILERKEEFFIVDLNKFKSTLQKRNSPLRNCSIYQSPDSSVKGNSWAVFYKLFSDKRVISKKDWEKGVRVPKFLFYNPQSKEDFDIKKIKKEDSFYLAPFEYSKRSLDQPIPFNDIGATLLEASFACLIYHPRFGDGYRDKEGRIFVRDKKTRKYKRLSHTFFVDYQFKGGNPTIYGDSIDHPQAFVKRKLPFLIEMGLISPLDFSVHYSSQTAKRERIEKRAMSPKGIVRINNVKHYLGRELAKELRKRKISIIQLDESLGGVVEENLKGEKRLIYVFNIVSPSKDLKQFKDGAYWAGKEKTCPRPYNLKEKFPRRADESLSDYQKRIEGLENFDFLLQFSQKLLEQTGVQFFRLPFEYQKILAYGFKKLKEKEDKVIELVKKYKIPGLMAFLSMEYGAEYGEKVLKMAETLPTVELKEIFNEYLRIIDTASGFEKIFRESLYLNKSNLSQEIKKRFAIDIREAILRRAKDLLICPYLIITEKKETDIGIQDIMLALKGLRKFLEIMRDFKKDSVENKIKFRKKKSHNKLDNLFYDVKDKDGYEYKLKIGIRPLEIKNGQARINFELNFNTDNPNEELKKAFYQEILYKKEKRIKKISRLRIAIDREVLGDKEFISLDIGRDKRDDKDFKRTGDVLGRTLAFVSESGHHTPDSFDSCYAKKEIFEEIAKSFKKFLEERDRISSTP